MKKLQGLLIYIGIVQLVLGAFFLFAPQTIMGMMGFTIPAADSGYMFGMLAARFIAFGIGMFWCARAPEQNLFWINNMILIQVIDLTVGIYYTATGIVDITSSAFPMFHAALFIVLLTLWRPKSATAMLTTNMQ